MVVPEWEEESEEKNLNGCRKLWKFLRKGVLFAVVKADKVLIGLLIQFLF